MEHRMALKKEKGFSATASSPKKHSPTSAVDSATHHQVEKCAKWEQWYQNITLSFCPRIKQLIWQNQTLIVRDLVHPRQPKSFNIYMVCRFHPKLSGRRRASNAPQKIRNVDHMFHSVCVTVSLHVRCLISRDSLIFSGLSLCFDMHYSTVR